MKTNLATADLSDGNSDTDALCSLIKIGPRRYIKALYEKGEMFCQTIDYFAKLEADAERSDPDEGLSKTYGRHTLRSVIISHAGNTVDLLPGMTSGLDIRLNSYKHLNIFCMTAIRDFGVVRVDTRCEGFGDSFLLLRYPALFIRKVEAAASRAGLEARSAPVEYVPKGNYAGNMGPFTKFDRLSHQSEFRFVLVPGMGRRFTLTLGPLRDVAVWGDLKDLSKARIEPGSG